MHNAKITAQKASLKSLAIKWESIGEISTDQKDEIISHIICLIFVSTMCKYQMLINILFFLSKQQLCCSITFPK